MITAFISSFMLVFFKVIQQLNVIHSLRVFAMLTSFIIAFGEIGVIVSGVRYGWDAAPVVGLGGSIAVVIAMSVHKYLRKLYD